MPLGKTPFLIRIPDDQGMVHTRNRPHDDATRADLYAGRGGIIIGKRHGGRALEQIGPNGPESEDRKTKVTAWVYPDALQKEVELKQNIFRSDGEHGIREQSTE